MKTVTIFVAMASLVSGCAPTPSANISPLTHDNAPVDLKKYNVATVLAFDSQYEGVKDHSAGEVFAKDLAWRLSNSYGPIFSQVKRGSAGIQVDELIVTGKLTKYDPGDRGLRVLIGFGVGAASLDGSLILKDAVDQHIVYEGKFSQFWGWGGAAGGSRGIEDMEAETIAAIGNTIAVSRGWSPPRGDEHPSYSDYRASLAPLTPERARIWFYRAGVAGFQLNMAVRVDGTYVGAAASGGFFCVNVEPGKHEITIMYDPNPSAIVNINAGSEVYVPVGFEGLGPRKPEPVAESTGASEISGLHLKGN